MVIRYLCCGLGILMLAAVVTTNLEDNAKIVHKIPTTHKIVALTIDDGPNPRTTPEILHLLKNKGVKATFFVLGENIERFPNVFLQEVSEGHEIGNHGYSHASLTKVSKDKIEKEIEKTDSIISAIAPRPTLFRPPGGQYNHQVLQVANNHHYRVVLWSIDTMDWNSPPVKNVVDVVMRNIKPGSIVLLHDGNYPLPTAKALSTIIDNLRAQGYEFVTVSELLQYYEVQPVFSLD